MRKVSYFVFIILLLAGMILVERRALLHTLAGTGMFKSMYAQSTIQLPNIPKAVSYNIYYSQTSGGSFSNSVRNIPNGTSSYTISYLKKNITYQYKISALDKSGKEIWWSKVSSFPDVHSM